MLLKVLPQDTVISVVPVNMGFDGSVKSRQRSRDPKRRDKRTFQTCGAIFVFLPSLSICHYSHTRMSSVRSLGLNVECIHKLCHRNADQQRGESLEMSGAFKWTEITAGALIIVFNKNHLHLRGLSSRTYDPCNELTMCVCVCRGETRTPAAAFVLGVEGDDRL